MRYTYYCLHRVIGLAAEDSPTLKEILGDGEAAKRAVFTSTPGAVCSPLSESVALANMMLDGMFGGETGDGGSIEDRLRNHTRQVEEGWHKQFGRAEFLLFSADGEVDVPDTTNPRDFGRFQVALDCLPKGEIAGRYEQDIANLLAAVGLAIPSVCGFQKVAKTTILWTDDGKPIYCFTFSMGVGELVVSRRISPEELLATQNTVSRITADTGLGRVVRLFNQSMEPHQDGLRRFLSAWTALEVFTNKHFAEYEKRFWKELSEGFSPAIRDRYLARIHTVMSDKYRLLDKFAVILAELDPHEADSEIANFEGAKKLRDKFAHGDEIDEKSLPVVELQALLRKLLLLHIERN